MEYLSPQAITDQFIDRFDEWFDETYLTNLPPPPDFLLFEEAEPTKKTRGKGKTNLTHEEREERRLIAIINQSAKRKAATKARKAATQAEKEAEKQREILRKEKLYEEKIKQRKEQQRLYYERTKEERKEKLAAQRKEYYQRNKEVVKLKNKLNYWVKKQEKTDEERIYNDKLRALNDKFLDEQQKLASILVE